jgi:hypothetical protein
VVAELGESHPRDSQLFILLLDETAQQKIYKGSPNPWHGLQTFNKLTVNKKEVLLSLYSISWNTITRISSLQQTMLVEKVAAIASEKHDNMTQAVEWLKKSMIWIFKLLA